MGLGVCFKGSVVFWEHMVFVLCVHLYSMLSPK